MVRQVCPTMCVSSKQNRSRNKSNAITEDQSQPSRNVLMWKQLHANKCPVFGVKCRICGKLNHYASECRSARKSKHKSHVKQCDISDDGNCDDILTLNAGKCFKNKMCANMLLVKLRKTIKFQLDSGATTNIISRSLTP
ncbi:hypothetical protein DPMN_115035 [Dreissena polymorpha]|uniref:CCHC-type domain-containing protein n=1 Tax=Dreissena polymorpha TaxID=45954 RepID=A0A9D4KKJ9_DREPO|nr:hypothetical protein DPMN_115035 [Dreissena polymorpha]